MDSFKVEKANAASRHGKLQKFTIVFRFMELCILLIILSRFSIQLPLAFKLSGEYFRGLFVTLFSPWFVFIVGNGIIIILYLKSGHLSSKNDEKKSKLDIYDEYVENCQRNQQNSTTSFDLKKRKIYRSQSENLESTNSKHQRALRRMATERNRKTIKYREQPVAASCAKDEMSSEEFRRMVEAFIARQQRFLREEE